MRNFKLEKQRYEREQMELALSKAIEQLDLPELKRLVDALMLEPAELKELQSKTSQLPNLHKLDPVKYQKARELSVFVNECVLDSKQDKAGSQNSFLTTRLTNVKSDDVK